MHATEKMAILVVGGVGLIPADHQEALVEEWVEQSHKEARGGTPTVAGVRRFWICMSDQGISCLASASSVGSEQDSGISNQAVSSEWSAKTSRTWFSPALCSLCVCVCGVHDVAGNGDPAPPSIQDYSTHERPHNLHN